MSFAEWPDLSEERKSLLEEKGRRYFIDFALEEMTDGKTHLGQVIKCFVFMHIASLHKSIFFDTTAT